jgi:site-specific recombinase XerD
VKPMSGNLAELIVKAVKTSISPAEAYNVAIEIPWLSEFLGRTGSNFVTANFSDLTAFCQEREKTRNERSMDRLIGNLRVIFQMLVNEGLRTDNPARLLPSPEFTVVATNYSIKRADIDALISWQGHRLQQANAFAYPIELRRLVLICLLAAGITVAELVHLDITDHLANVVKAGRNEMREGLVHLDDVASSALSRWLEHRANIPVGDGAMFPTFRPPWPRLQLKSVSQTVKRLIEDAGPRYSHLRPGTLYRSMYAAIVEDELGWSLAIGAGGRKSVPHVVRPAPSIEKLALMVERFHPLGSLTSRISNSQGEE